MKALAIGNRLERDLGAQGLIALPPDGLLEILDAINGGLQRMHALAPYQSKTTTGSIYVAAPATVTIGVTQGSPDITGHFFSADQIYGTIRIAGDSIDNQISGDSQILHPYGGETGTVTAVIYSDGVAIAEPYEQLLGDPRILETGAILVHFTEPWEGQRSLKQIGRPTSYRVESNARNRNSPAPAVIRFNRLPDRSYRLEAQFLMSPITIALIDLISPEANLTLPGSDSLTLTDLLGPGFDLTAPAADIPLRAELIENYLLPIARGILSSSERWKTANRDNARADGKAAESKYEALVPRNLATPNNRLVTRHGW